MIADDKITLCQHHVCTWYSRQITSTKYRLIEPEFSRCLSWWSRCSTAESHSTRIFQGKSGSESLLRTHSCVVGGSCWWQYDREWAQLRTRQGLKKIWFNSTGWKRPYRLCRIYSISHLPSAIVLRIDLFLRFLEGNLWPLGQHGILSSMLKRSPCQILVHHSKGNMGLLPTAKGTMLRSSNAFQAKYRQYHDFVSTFWTPQVCDKAAKVQREWK